MKPKIAFGTLTSLLILASVSTPSAQILHVNDEWEECAFVIDSSLTQEAWHQFAEEAGIVTYLRPLSSAKPLGVGKYEVSILNWGTNINDADDAWNDTFSHPYDTHWLFEGSALFFPGLMFRTGVSEQVGVGVYFTKNVKANYGFFGAQVQYNFANDSTRNMDLAARFSFTSLFGPEDLNFAVYGVDFVASTDVSRFTPYASVSGHLSRAQETTDKVDLSDENIFGLQGAVGVTSTVSAVQLGAELNVAKVMGYSFKLGFVF